MNSGFIANMDGSRSQDMSYYNGSLKALEFAGYDWQRDVNGKNRVWKARRFVVAETRVSYGGIKCQN